MIGTSDISDRLINAFPEFAVVSKSEIGEWLDALIGEVFVMTDSRGLALTRLRPGGVGGAVSLHPRNIIVNWQKASVGVAASVLTVVGLLDKAPWLAIFAAAVVWDRFSTINQLSLTEAEARLLWLFWRAADADNYVPIADLPVRLEEVARQEQVSPLAPAEIEPLLASLVKKQLIRHSIADSSQWRLVEKLTETKTDPRLI